MTKKALFVFSALFAYIHLFNPFIEAQEIGKNAPQITRTPPRAKQLVDKAIPYLKVKDIKKALPYLDSAVATDSNYISALWEAGWGHYLVENWEKVYILWNRIQKINPNMPDLAINLRMAEDRLNSQKLIDSLPLPPPDLQIDTLPDKTQYIQIAAVGDIQMGRAWPPESAALPPEGPASIFANVKQYLKADVTFGNLETVLSNSGGSLKAQKKGGGIFIFRVPTSYSRALGEAGFNVVSTANNHANDFKTYGIYETMKALDSVHIHHSGRTGKIASWEKNGLKLCMVAFSTQEAAFTLQKVDDARKLINWLDKQYDIVIVSFHAGAEGVNATIMKNAEEFYHGENRGNPLEFAHIAIDAGADLVLGHGPHVLRAMEIYKGRLIAYSLGNFSSYKSFSTAGLLQYSVILNVQLTSNGICTKAQLTPIVFNSDGIPFVDPQKNAIKIINDLSAEQFKTGAISFDSTGVFSRY